MGEGKRLRSVGAVLACAARTAGLSIRANRVPMVVLWGLAGVTLALYHFVPAVAESFSPLLEWEEAYGWRAAVVNRVVFTGIVPGVFLLLIRELRPQHPFVTLALQVAWCGMWGVLCDRMYVWDYVTCFAHYPMPYPNWRVLQPNLKLMQKNILMIL